MHTHGYVSFVSGVVRIVLLCVETAEQVKKFTRTCIHVSLVLGVIRVVLSGVLT